MYKRAQVRMVELETWLPMDHHFIANYGNPSTYIETAGCCLSPSTRQSYIPRHASAAKTCQQLWIALEGCFGHSMVDAVAIFYQAVGFCCAA
jgi:hypothetical protein